MLKLHKEFHSTPELSWEQQNSELMTASWTAEVEAPQGCQSAEDWRKSQSQENVYALELQANNQRNSRRSWVAGNKKGSGAPRHPGVRYHGSWQSIEDSYRQGEDGDEDDETEEEDPGDEDGEDAATPIADQVNLLGNRDYRAVKPCRPIYSTGNCNTLPKRAGSPHCAAPPPNHPPTPPPPPSQVVRVDVAKSHSEYAAVAAAAATGGERPTTPVMSSFRPSDNAKLYALPEDLKNVGYMTLRPTGCKKVTVPQTGSPPSSSASRSKSLPPRSSRPSVVVKPATKNEESRVSVTVNSTPVIPDPDYDSEEEAQSRHASRAPRTIVTPGSSAGEPRTKLLIEIKQQHPQQQQQQKEGGNLPKSQSFCSDILKAKSKLKTSQSFPEELSDCQQDTEDAYVTFVPVNGSQPDTDETQYAKAARRTGTLTRHAVSLIQLPPPVENGETESEDRLNQQCETAVEQDSVSTISTLSSLSTSTNSSERDATILENHKPVKKINGHWREASAGGPSEHQQSSDGERTIEESLQLIRKHVDELSGMNRPPAKKSAPVVPPPPQFFEVASSESEDPFLAPPPPEFSDAVMMTHKPGQPQRLLPKSMSSGQLRGSLGDGSDDAVPISFSSHFLNRRIVERRMSDDALGKPTTVRVVGTVPKKVSFSPDVIEAETTRAGHQELMTTTRRFPHKPLHEWTVNDTADWLDSIFLNEYKGAFMKRGVDGPSLMRINNEALMNLGVKRLGHRLNMEKSLKHYAREPRN